MHLHGTCCDDDRHTWCTIAITCVGRAYCLRLYLNRKLSIVCGTSFDRNVYLVVAGDIHGGRLRLIWHCDEIRAASESSIGGQRIYFFLKESSSALNQFYLKCIIDIKIHNCRHRHVHNPMIRTWVVWRIHLIRELVRVRPYFVSYLFVLFDEKSTIHFCIDSSGENERQTLKRLARRTTCRTHMYVIIIKTKIYACLFWCQTVQNICWKKVLLACRSGGIAILYCLRMLTLFFCTFFRTFFFFRNLDLE